MAATFISMADGAVEITSTSAWCDDHLPPRHGGSPAKRRRLSAKHIGADVGRVSANGTGADIVPPWRPGRSPADVAATSAPTGLALRWDLAATPKAQTSKASGWLAGLDLSASHNGADRGTLSASPPGAEGGTWPQPPRPRPASLLDGLRAGTSAPAIMALTVGHSAPVHLALRWALAVSSLLDGLRAGTSAPSIMALTVGNSAPAHLALRLDLAVSAVAQPNKPSGWLGWDLSARCTGAEFGHVSAI
uniref:Uncharacterized protein n=1 Tax=Oryza sativa subsp. japonica TaxID=39947 RepID=Q84M66_ORYSJ|nr:hypothetical protein [Oryza sativa Japonica Group]